MSDLVVHALHHGRRRKPIVEIVPDHGFPELYRIAWPSGELSIVANISRCKDAARRWAQTEYPELNARQFQWTCEPQKSRASGSIDLRGRGHWPEPETGSPPPTDTSGRAA